MTKAVWFVVPLVGGSDIVSLVCRIGREFSFLTSTFFFLSLLLISYLENLCLIVFYFVDVSKWMLYAYTWMFIYYARSFVCTFMPWWVGKMGVY